MIVIDCVANGLADTYTEKTAFTVIAACDFFILIMNKHGSNRKRKMKISIIYKRLITVGVSIQLVEILMRSELF